MPQLHEPWESSDVLDDNLVYRIKRSIYCELRSSVHDIMHDPNLKAALIREKLEPAIPDNWAAQLTLKLTVDETGSFGPSATYNQPLSPDRSIAQSFNLPASILFSSQATRIDTYYSFYSAKGLKADYDPGETACSEEGGKDLDRHGSSYLLSSNLGMKSWLIGALKANFVPPSSEGATFKDGVFQYDIRFIVITTGTINPTWRLVPINTGTAGFPLFSANRTRTHDLLITFGAAETKNGKTMPSTQANNLHSAGQTEQSIAAGIRSGLQRLE